MLVPRALKNGDRVAIVAPASPFRTDELTQGLDIISAAGLIPVLGPNVKNLRSNRSLAATAPERARELMWAFTDPTIKGVITATGGYGSAQVLPHLNFETIRKSRKVLLGMSDISSLSNGILARSELISINGQYPSIRVDEGKRLFESDSKSMEFVLDLIMSREPWGERPFEINQMMPRTVSPGVTEGIAVGVNLHVLQHLIGTPFMPDLRGAILFIEGTHQDGQMLGRMLTQFRLAGMLDVIAGAVIGEFVDVPKKEKESAPSIEDIIHEFFSKGPPCSFGYSFSHGPMTVPIPIGAMTHLDADSGDVSFDFSMV
jgi:muramoyltetrapeptide carboxypeptidase